jgi:hypothetical protein
LTAWRVQKIHGVGSGASHLNRKVEPFARLGPADIKLIFLRENKIERIVVDGHVAMKLGVGSVHPFVHSKLVEVGTVRRVQATASLVFRIGVVIRHAFPAQIVIRALHAPRNLLWATGVYAVVEGLSAIMLLLARCGQAANQQGQRERCKCG